MRFFLIATAIPIIENNGQWKCSHYTTVTTSPVPVQPIASKTKSQLQIAQGERALKQSIVNKVSADESQWGSSVVDGWVFGPWMGEYLSVDGWVFVCGWWVFGPWMGGYLVRGWVSIWSVDGGEYLVRTWQVSRYSRMWKAAKSRTCARCVT